MHSFLLYFKQKEELDLEANYMHLPTKLIGDTKFNTSKKLVVFVRTGWLMIVRRVHMIADFLIFNDL